MCGTLERGVGSCETKDCISESQAAPLVVIAKLL